MPGKLKIGVLGGLDVSPHKGDQALAVLALQQCDQLPVFVANHREKIGVADTVRPDRVCLPCQLLDHLDQQLVAARGKERLVEQKVFTEDSPQVASLDRCTMPRMDGTEFPHQRRRRGEDHQTRGTGFDQRADHVQLFNFFNAVVANGSTTIGLAYHDAHGFEIGKGLARNVALDVEAQRKILFDQALAGADLAQRDLLLERIDYLGNANWRLGTLNSLVHSGSTGVWQSACAILP